MLSVRGGRQESADLGVSTPRALRARAQGQNVPAGADAAASTARSTTFSPMLPVVPAAWTMECTRKEMRIRPPGTPGTFKGVPGSRICVVKPGLQLFWDSFDQRSEFSEDSVTQLRSISKILQMSGLFIAINFRSLHHPLEVFRVIRRWEC